MTLDSIAYGVGRTHEPVLAAVVAMATPGPILEVGAGNYSTPLLHAMCLSTGRDLLTIDGDKSWIDRFYTLRSEKHHLVSVENWDDIHPMAKDKKWFCIFIDHAPAERRIVDIEALADCTEFMVVHDTEHPIYNYEPTFAKFKYRYDYKRLCPWTTVLSNVRPFPFDL